MSTDRSNVEQAVAWRSQAAQDDALGPRAVLTRARYFMDLARRELACLPETDEAQSQLDSLIEDADEALCRLR